MSELSMDKKTIALNLLDIEDRIRVLHRELEALHEMRESLLEDLSVAKNKEN